MSGYAAGVRTEHAVMHHLTENGYECTRATSPEPLLEAAITTPEKGQPA